MKHYNTKAINEATFLVFETLIGKSTDQLQINDLYNWAAKLIDDTERLTYLFHLSNLKKETIANHHYQIYLQNS